MTVLDSWLYGNPETIAIRKEEAELRKARACGDCVHRRSEEFQGEVWNFCEFKRKRYGTRCDLYEAKKS
ncbi:MAG: hypothetical protein H7293_16780 [Candidatus Saccharibacteria bacterium]|nr:hypothetical protein [Rhodoferax sp.]